MTIKEELQKEYDKFNSLDAQKEELKQVMRLSFLEKVVAGEKFYYTLNLSDMEKEILDEWGLMYGNENSTWWVVQLIYD